MFGSEKYILWFSADNPRDNTLHVLSHHAHDLQQIRFQPHGHDLDENNVGVGMLDSLLRRYNLLQFSNIHLAQR